MVRVVPLEKGGEVKQFFVEELDFVFDFCSKKFNFLSESHSSPNQNYSILVYGKMFITESEIEGI